MKGRGNNLISDLITRKYKASAMYFALFVSTIIALLLALLLVFIFTNRKVDAIALASNKMIEESNTAIIDFCKQPLVAKENGLKTNYWGTFQLITSQVKQRNKSFISAALICNNPRANSLILREDDGNLKMGDGATIKGEALVPGGYVTPSYQLDPELNYSTEKLGDSKQFPFPELSQAWLNYNDSLYHSCINGDGMNYDFKKGHANSFKFPVKNYFKKGAVVLSQNYFGNIIISSATKIIIERQANLKDVILVAPKIAIRDQFSGNLHIITEEIDIGKDVNLKYPSSIVLNNYEEQRIVNFPPNIKLDIANTTKFSGNIVMINMSNTGKDFEGILRIDKGALIEGGVYNTGLTELYGEIKGNLITSKLLARKKGGIHINTLLGGKLIYSPKFSLQPGLPLENFDKLNIASWLY